MLVTKGTTDAFTFHALSSPTSVNFVMFLLGDVAIAWYCYVNHHGCPLFFVNDRYVWLVRHHLSVSLSHRILAQSFSTTFGGVSHLELLH